MNRFIVVSTSAIPLINKTIGYTGIRLEENIAADSICDRRLLSVRMDFYMCEILSQIFGVCTWGILTGRLHNLSLISLVMYCYTDHKFVQKVNGRLS
jgi:hypothetical protein